MGEWESMEKPLEAATKNTHLSLQKWLFDRAKVLGLRKKDASAVAEADSDESDGESDGDDPSSPASGGKTNTTATTAETKSKETKAEEKNWSSVYLVYQESKLQFRGALSEVNFSNWVWKECIRRKLDESKGSMDSIEENDGELDEATTQGIEDVNQLLAEFYPADVIKARADAEKKKEKKAEKKDKKEDKKSKKED